MFWMPNLALAVMLSGPLACVEGETGPAGPRGVKGLEGARGYHGEDGTDGGVGDMGQQGQTGTNGQDGTACSISPTSNGIQVICEDGTTTLIQNGVDGNSGQNGSDGTTCHTVETDGGISLLCEDGTSTLIRRGVNGTPGNPGENGQNGTVTLNHAPVNGNNGSPGANGQNGTSCSFSSTEEGQEIVCEDGTTTTVRNGNNGVNGGPCAAIPTPEGVQIHCQDGTQSHVNNGQNGNNGTHGSDCTAVETGNGLRITCGDSSAVVKDGTNGQAGTNGLNGDDGAHGQGCSLQTADNGVTVSCDTGSETILNGSNCTTNTDSNSWVIECPHLNGGSSSATLEQATYVRSFGPAAVTDRYLLTKNNALFILFDAPATGLFDEAHILQGDQDNGAENFELELAVFEQVGSTWQIASGSNVYTVDNSTTTGGDHKFYFGTGLNAQLTQGTSYLFVIRNAGPSSTWKYGAHNSGTSDAPFTAFTHSAATSLATLQVDHDDLNGSRYIPFFHLNQ